MISKKDTKSHQASAFQGKKASLWNKLTRQRGVNPYRLVPVISL
jgi:hypothetical protein